MARETVLRLWLRLKETCLAMIGVPNYEAYRSHLARHHPDQAPMDYQTFFRDAQRRRYEGSKGGRCC